MQRINGTDVRHVDVSAGIDCNGNGIARRGDGTPYRSNWCDIAVASRSKHRDNVGVIAQDVDVVLPVNSDASWPIETSFGSRDGGAGQTAALASLRVNRH